MNYVDLKAELDNDPVAVGYATYLPSATGKVAELINEQKFSAVKMRMVTARAILAECVDGATILDKLEAASASISAVKWAVKFLSLDAGIDIGNTTTRYMIDQLVLGGVLTAGESSQLKNLAMQPASRAEVLGFGRVESTDIQKALES